MLAFGVKQKRPGIGPGRFVEPFARDHDFVTSDACGPF
jgi:hypothetical protein